MIRPDTTTNGGFALLLSVLFIGAAVAAVTVWMLQGSVSTAQSITALEDRAHVRVLAETCAERVLGELRARAGLSFLRDTYAAEDGRCVYRMERTGSEARSISIDAVVRRAHASLRVEVDALYPVIGIASWEWRVPRELEE